MDFNFPERVNDKALKILQKQFGRIEPRIVKEVTEWIMKFKTSSGNITRSKENKERLAAFKRAFERFMEKSGYNKMVSGYLQAFDEVAAHQQKLHEEVNGIKLKKSFTNLYKTFSVNNVISAMQGQGLNQSIIGPLKQELFIAVNQGSSLSDVIQSITSQLTTTTTRQGILKRQVLQASRDAILQYDGIVNEAVRKTYKLNGIQYVGSLVKDSRLQCETWVNETKNGKKGLLLFSDLEEEIKWAENNGTGMIPNTTPENFCQNRGGYNCRHIAYPVRIKT